MRPNIESLFQLRLRLVVALFLLLISGCQTPFLTLPGGQLTGAEINTSSFKFASEFSLLQLEVRPAKPYSIWLRVSVISDKLYIDAASHRRWHEYLKEDPHVRVKLGEKVYRATAVPVSDEEILKEFIGGRSVYHINPTNGL
jgi:hypothetical protein